MLGDDRRERERVTGVSGLNQTHALLPSDDIFSWLIAELTRKLTKHVDACKCLLTETKEKI